MSEVGVIKRRCPQVRCHEVCPVQLSVIERGAVPARITDLHVWRVGRAKYAVVVTVSTPSDASADDFRRALGVHEELAHVTVEVERSEAT